MPRRAVRHQDKSIHMTDDKVEDGKTPKAKVTADPADWDRDYRSGRWNYLTEPREQARLAVAALYVRLFGPGDVLDIGCGAGQLFHLLDPEHVTSYTGVDFSNVVLETARLDPTKTRLVHASAEAFAPAQGARYDSILFNEVIYFIADPLAELRRYGGFLKPGGVIVLSITRARAEGGSWDRKINALWTALDSGPWLTLDEVFVGHRASGNTWRLRALRPTDRA